MATSAGTIMDFASALMNDVQKQVYNYTVQLPYLKMALRDLTERMELADIPATHKTSTVLTIPAGITEIGFGTTPALPADFIQFIDLYESASGVEKYVRVTPLDYKPLTRVTTSNYGVYHWANNTIYLPESASINDLLVHYIGSLAGNIVDENSFIGIVNGESFLQYRTAALCAQYIGENKERADDLNNAAGTAFDIAMGIETKAKQVHNTRRRPFRSGWKRGY